MLYQWSLTEHSGLCIMILPLNWRQSILQVWGFFMSICICCWSVQVQCRSLYWYMFCWSVHHFSLVSGVSWHSCPCRLCCLQKIVYVYLFIYLFSIKISKKCAMFIILLEISLAHDIWKRKGLLGENPELLGRGYLCDGKSCSSFDKFCWVQFMFQ